MCGIITSDCYRLPDQEEVDQAYYSQIGAASHLPSPVLIGDFNRPHITQQGISNPGHCRNASIATF